MPKSGLCDLLGSSGCRAHGNSSLLLSGLVWVPQWPGSKGEGSCFLREVCGGVLQKINQVGVSRPKGNGGVDSESSREQQGDPPSGSALPHG